MEASARRTPGTGVPWLRSLFIGGPYFGRASEEQNNTRAPRLRKVAPTYGDALAEIPGEEITRKLDADFFSGRWSRATDRQRELMWVIATLQNSAAEFTVQEIVEHSPEVLEKGFSASHANQMLEKLSAEGLVYKNRRGKYLLAVPLLDKFIRRVWGDMGAEEDDAKDE